METPIHTPISHRYTCQSIAKSVTPGCPWKRSLRASSSPIVLGMTAVQAKVRDSLRAQPLAKTWKQPYVYETRIYLSSRLPRSWLCWAWLFLSAAGGSWTSVGVLPMPAPENRFQGNGLIMAIVSDTSNTPQSEIGNYLGLHITLGF